MTKVYDPHKGPPATLSVKTERMYKIMHYAIKNMIF